VPEVSSADAATQPEKESPAESLPDEVVAEQPGVETVAKPEQADPAATPVKEKASAETKAKAANPKPRKPKTKQ